MPGDEDDKEAGGRGGCAAGISLDATLSALYSSSEPRPLLELVTTASNRLSSRSIDDWLGLMMLTAGEAPADDRPAKECSVDGTAKNPKTHNGVNSRSKYLAQGQPQRPESSVVSLTRHACKIQGT